MPFIIITGFPSSGKTTRTQQIKSYFEERGKEVHVVSEYEQIVKAGFQKNKVYADSSKEKHIRGLLKSEVFKLINKNSLVILDGLNYIKGYRYELYCGTKNNKCTQLTLHTIINNDVAWSFNNNREMDAEKYDRDIFDALIMRYEEPESKNRWDSPLSVVLPDGELDLNAMFESLFNKNPPKPNQSTQNAPLSATNFLYELDKITKEITDVLVKAKTLGDSGEVSIPGYANLNVDITNVTTNKLMLLRRQYISFSKMHTPEMTQIPYLYVQYLKTSIN